MRQPRTVAAALICLLAIALTPVPAEATPPDRGQPTGAAPLLTTDETGCTEIAYWRGGSASKVRALVPARYELVPFPAPEGFPARVALVINEVTCRNTINTGPSRRDRQRDVTTILISVNTSSIDGNPSDGYYNLFYATENRTQQQELTTLGWPADLLKQRSDVEVTTTSGGLTQAITTVVGSGWDHEVTGATIFPLDQPVNSEVAFHRDTATRQLQLCFSNTLASAAGAVTGDLTTTPLATITAAPPTYAGFSAAAPFGAGIATGGWQATLTDQACPKPSAR
jgi:hypothetical protein